jgi:hypothetical protein
MAECGVRNDAYPGKTLHETYPAAAPSSGKAVTGVSMPTISAFFGVVIQMFWREHGPPHFHAIYGEHEAVIDIRELRLMRGVLPRRARALVLEWAVDHRRGVVGRLQPMQPVEAPKTDPAAGGVPALRPSTPWGVRPSNHALRCACA